MPTGHSLPPATIKAIQDDWRAGDSATVIRLRYGISRRTVWRWVSDIRDRPSVFAKNKVDARRAIQLLAEGKSQGEVAKALGVSRTSVVNLLRKWRSAQCKPVIPRKPFTGRKLSNGDLSEITDAWINGENGKPVTLDDLAAFYEVHPRTIHGYVKHLERKVAPLVPDKRRKDAERRQIFELKAQGMRQIDIAARLNVSRGWVCNVLREQRIADGMRAIGQEVRHAA